MMLFFVMMGKKELMAIHIYDFSPQTMDGKRKSLADYKGKVMLIVNTASKCGFTPQFDGLQKLYDTYKQQGLIVLGFPCNQFARQDPGTNKDIEQFCRKNYGVTFPMFSKVDVKGAHADPLFVYLTQEAKGMLTKDIKWNFTKFLIARNGDVVDRFAPQTKPENLKDAIERTLATS